MKVRTYLHIPHGGVSVDGYKHRVDARGCWILPNKPGANGYVRIQVRVHGKRCTLAAHRAFYVARRGALSNALTLDHLCRNRACVNPAHLEPATMRENSLRGIGPTAVNARKTHCIRGHELNDKNTRVDRTGSRCCRRCQNVYDAKRLPRRLHGAALDGRARGAKEG